MAHETQVTGALSEHFAAIALLNAGYEVSKPVVPEVYDYTVRDPLNKRYYRVQVKTLRIRADRDNALVVYAKKGNGEPYTTADTDYIIGVDLANQRCYMFECRGVSEYWSTEESAKERWIELNIFENNESEGDK